MVISEQEFNKKHLKYREKEEKKFFRACYDSKGRFREDKFSKWEEESVAKKKKKAKKKKSKAKKKKKR